MLKLVLSAVGGVAFVTAMICIGARSQQRVVDATPKPVATMSIQDITRYADECQGRGMRYSNYAGSPTCVSTDGSARVWLYD